MQARGTSVYMSLIQSVLLRAVVNCSFAAFKPHATN